MRTLTTLQYPAGLFTWSHNTSSFFLNYGFSRKRWGTRPSATAAATSSKTTQPDHWSNALIYQ